MVVLIMSLYMEGVLEEADEVGNSLRHLFLFFTWTVC